MARLNSRWVESFCPHAELAHSRHAKIRHHIAFVIIPSRFRPAAIGYQSHPFAYCYEPISRHPLITFMQAIWPKYLNVHRSRRSKAEVQPRIIAREKAGLAKHRLRLSLPAVMNHDASAYGAAIRFYAFQLNFNPVGLSREVVSEQRRRLIEIDDDDVHITIVIEIAEGAAAAAMGRPDARTCFFD